ncbi:hypothetical protein [Streptomyces lancefieldiae]|uniref:Secreted protein n=1 Tax=Streptomyces lancefieldiae TaxID=3075520 RepID=A0ABU3AZ93_9ACTN|nr:hypothetical protein [Streptomyces sp. DSM 40712]MDT0615243.1 hypothetical protein [Streptomyces sp. DSM 40712]
MKTGRHLAGAAATAALLTGALTVAPAAQADAGTAASCYGSAINYSKPEGDVDLPAGRLFVTSGNCADINIKPRTNRYIMVCLETASGGSSCPSAYTLAEGGVWNVLRSNVPDGTQFYFRFRSAALSNGSWAA